MKASRAVEASELSPRWEESKPVERRCPISSCFSATKRVAERSRARVSGMRMRGAVEEEMAMEGRRKEASRLRTAVKSWKCSEESWVSGAMGVRAVAREMESTQLITRFERSLHQHRRKGWTRREGGGEGGKEG